MNLLSVIVPCYNEAESILLFYDEINKVSCQMKDVNFEILFVDDGSTDQTLDEIKFLCENDNRIEYISFSRNFGKESAMYAGLKKAKGDYIVIMDADLQHPPKMLIGMYDALKSGEYDLAAARRTRIGDAVCKTFFARKFYKIANRLSKTKLEDGSGDYRMMTRQVADSILSMGEYNRFMKGMFGWVGFRTKWFDYDNVQRVAGKTKWSFKGLFSYSVEGIISFSTVPLSLASFIGVLFCLISLIYTIVIIIKTILFGDPVAGYPSMICIVMLIGGIQLLCIGIVGQYISKIYLESKHRPIYIIKEESLYKQSKNNN